MLRTEVHPALAQQCILFLGVASIQMPAIMPCKGVIKRKTATHVFPINLPNSGTPYFEFLFLCSILLSFAETLMPHWIYSCVSPH